MGLLHGLLHGPPTSTFECSEMMSLSSAPQRGNVFVIARLGKESSGDFPVMVRQVYLALRELSGPSWSSLLGSEAAGLLYGVTEEALVLTQIFPPLTQVSAP